MKLPEVRAYGKLWQDRLKLSEWDVTWRWMTKSEEKEHPDWNGYCVWSEQHKSARIMISKQADYIPHTIIHELMHIRLDGHEPMLSEQSISTEITINALASMLVVLEGTRA